MTSMHHCLSNLKVVGWATPYNRRKSNYKSFLLLFYFTKQENISSSVLFFSSGKSFSKEMTEIHILAVLIVILLTENEKDR